MKVIEDVETIGVYHDEIRIISKKEPPQSVKRDTHLLSVTDVVRVVDDTVGREKRVEIQMKKGVNCKITDDEVRCGWFIGNLSSDDYSGNRDDSGNTYQTEKERQDAFENGEHYTF